MEKLLTTKDLADAIGASESSMRRWTNSGVIATSRTVGGHRRIPLSEAIRFIRESKSTIVRPDLLGLPEKSGQLVGTGEMKAVEAEVFEALKSGDAAAARGRILSEYLSGIALATIFDETIQPAMKKMGELWKHDSRGILIEHRAHDICLQAIASLRQLLPPAGLAAPVALGGAPQGDRYILPSLMVAAVLADCGYREINFGPETPVEFLAQAAEERKASLVCLSISTIEEKTRLQSDIEKLSEQLQKQNIRLVVGGRLAGEISIRLLSNVQYLPSMTELAAFARGARTQTSNA